MNSLFECCCSLESVPPEEAPTTRRMTAEEEQAAKRTLAIRLPRPPPLMEVVDHTVAAPRASKLLESPLVHEAVSKRFCISNMTPPLDAHQPFAALSGVGGGDTNSGHAVCTQVRGCQQCARLCTGQHVRQVDDPSPCASGGGGGTASGGERGELIVCRRRGSV
eukprot:gnl/TRDRNA2_/TRDRNA2_82958_c0_seq2.p1 gnl/TRDRNA2_/TRDRNA2_82958_c0~~gnl/TRDRNA2_/TRDRNA2_82958_c0_seq2.p1  ORF type:complete len:164 (-),score=19.36 gnl/TRDRNA2_/TRDRNA2_82958_c0_seq2:354-845(-)